MTSRGSGQPWLRATALGLVFLAGVAVYLALARSGLLALLLDGEALRARIADLGLWGPAAVVALMTLAILVSPIPSAPIAVAAGAAYGHTWGTLYVLLGAECGALAAFGLARWLGHEALHRWFGDRLARGWLGSQRALTGFVLVTRLLPFVSFDLVSYAAGLSVLRFWRFAAATLIGTVPASFVLAHFGGEMASGEGGRIMLAVIALGGLTLVPVLGAFWQRRRRRLARRGGRQSPGNYPDGAAADRSALENGPGPDQGRQGG